MASSSKSLSDLSAGETIGDRISELPDPLLVQILSLLPTVEAFRTSILSKRWKYIWTSIHNFSFCFSEGEVEKFQAFVDYVLAQSVSSKIEKFELNSLVAQDLSSLSRWISFAVERKVEHVLLLADGYPSLSEAFCTCSSLITLDIIGFDFPTYSMSWKSLKSIKMEHMWVNYDEFVTLLAGCPELESMELRSVNCFHRLEIRSKNLKRLYLYDLCVDRLDEDTSMEIFAPYLEHFGISGDVQDNKFRFLDVSSLVSANLTYRSSCFNSTCKFSDDEEEDEDEEDSRQDYHQDVVDLVADNLKKLSCVTELRLGSWFTELIGLPIPELKCKKLTLELDVDFNLYGAACILRQLPHVETLNIWLLKPFDGRRCHFELRLLADEDYLDLPRWITSFEFPNLKNVTIDHFFDLCLISSDFEALNQCAGKLFKLSEFVLKNAKVLEKFVISKSVMFKPCSRNNPFFPGLYCWSKTLAGRPRASSNCVMIIGGVSFP